MDKTKPISGKTFQTMLSVIRDKFANITKQINAIAVPTKTSELTNDSGYLTTIPDEYVTETELTAKGYLTEHQSLSDYAKTADIPTKVSELTNDSGYLTSVPAEYVTETELTAKGYLTAVPGEYVTETELTAKGYLTIVPDEYITETELTAKGYLTEHQSLAAYAKTADLGDLATKDSLTASEVGAMPRVAVTTSDNGKFLRVVNGAWAAASIPSAEEASF